MRVLKLTDRVILTLKNAESCLVRAEQCTQIDTIQSEVAGAKDYIQDLILEAATKSEEAR